MDQLKAVNIKIVPRISAHIIPRTDYKFTLELDDSQFVYLRNIETGERQILIQGSPNSFYWNTCSFFLKGGDGYELHFCTVKQEKGTTVN